ncbi:MFS transporter [Pseudonocardia saturnea]
MKLHFRPWAGLRRVRELPVPLQLLIGTQLAFNTGFYLVLPFLAGHLAGDLALAGWLVGLVLGVRTFSQQGLFAVGGALADRFGAKPMILAGCAVRVAGFVALGLATDLPGVLLGAGLTGVAGALFSPAVESSLAREGGELEERGGPARTEVFALFAIAGEVGAVTGPLLGAALLVVDFSAVCLVAASGFVVIGLAHARWLPARPAAHASEGVFAGWREVLANRRFVLFALGYSGYLVSYNQLFMALPVELRRATGGEAALGPLFALASIMVVLGQLGTAAWARRRLGHARGLVAGFALMGLSFVAVAVLGPLVAGIGPAVVMVVLLIAGQMLAVPLAQDLVPRMAGERRLGSYFGVLASIGGLTVLAGSTVTGGLLDLAGRPGWLGALPWLALAAFPLAGAVVLAALARSGSLTRTT